MSHHVSWDLCYFNLQRSGLPKIYTPTHTQRHTISVPSAEKWILKAGKIWALLIVYLGQNSLFAKYLNSKTTLLTPNLMQIWMRCWTQWWREWRTLDGAASTAPKLWPTRPWWDDTVRSTWTVVTPAMFVERKLKPGTHWRFTREDIMEMVLA